MSTAACAPAVAAAAITIAATREPTTIAVAAVAAVLAAT